MFSFFKKKPTETEAIAYGKGLAKRAVLDVAFQDGTPTFVIVVDQPGVGIGANFEHRQAIAEFIAVIEKRIIDEFPSDPNEYLGLPADILGDRSYEFKQARRVVGSSESKGLFQWRYDKNSVIQIGLMTEKI
jgi:hypothetical protein